MTLSTSVFTLKKVTSSPMTSFLFGVVRTLVKYHHSARALR